MTRMMRALLLLLVLLPSLAHAQPAITRPVTDPDDYLTHEQEEDLAQMLVHMREVSKVQMAVVVIRSTDGVPIEDYTLRMAESWGGGGKEGNAVIYVLAIQDRTQRLEVGRAVEPSLPDEAAAHILDQQSSLLRLGDHSAAAREVTREVGERVREGMFLEVEAEEVPQAEQLWALVAAPVITTPLFPEVAASSRAMASVHQALSKAQERIALSIDLSSSEDPELAIIARAFALRPPHTHDPAPYLLHTRPLSPPLELSPLTAQLAQIQQEQRALPIVLVMDQVNFTATQLAPLLRELGWRGRHVLLFAISPMAKPPRPRIARITHTPDFVSSDSFSYDVTYGPLIFRQTDTLPYPTEQLNQYVLEMTRGVSARQAPRAPVATKKRAPRSGSPLLALTLMVLGGLGLAAFLVMRHKVASRADISSKTYAGEFKSWSYGARDILRLLTKLGAVLILGGVVVALLSGGGKVFGSVSIYAVLFLLAFVVWLMANVAGFFKDSGSSQGYSPPSSSTSSTSSWGSSWGSSSSSSTSSSPSASSSSGGSASSASSNSTDWSGSSSGSGFDGGGATSSW